MPGVVTVQQLDSQISGLIRRTQTRQASFIPRGVAMIAKTGIMKTFNEGKSPNGVPWTRLAHPRIITKGSDKPLLNTGLLRASIQSKATATEIIVSSNLEYAGVHQHGATIVPRHGRALSIPLTREAQRAGGARHFPRPLFMIQRKNKPPFLAERKETGKGKKKKVKIIIHYVLVKRSVIPARPFLGFSRETMTQINRLVVGEVQRIMRIGDGRQAA